MPTYAWIPVVNPRLNRAFFFSRLEEDDRVQSVGPHDTIIETPIRERVDWRAEFTEPYRNRVREELGCSSTDPVYFSLKVFSDKNHKHVKRYAFSLGAGAVIRKTTILNRLRPDPQSGAPDQTVSVESRGAIDDIDAGGLVKFDVTVADRSAGEEVRETLTRYHFEVVRDTYHDHVFHEGSDFLLLPVTAEAEDPIEERQIALRSICDQFMAMVVNNQQAIQLILTRARMNREITESAYVDGLQLISHARGALVWCAQFHKLFKNRGHALEHCLAVERPFENAERSLRLLQEEFEYTATPKLLTATQRRTNLIALIGITMSFVIMLNLTILDEGKFVGWVNFLVAAALPLCLVGMLYVGYVFLRMGPGELEI